jgi:hypothetical protein
MTRNERIRRQLDYLEDRGILDGWQLQGNMPGHRWTVWGKFSSGRAYTTSEVECFLDGTNACQATMHGAFRS